ncbi:MAG: Asp-tRNA(Asn)/Glu-tRNA(Gln) amidotransferase subunit GatA [Firmicutes bacterium]|nr:Asp-tRNA(Asn)/Glu-tRNA(Gln) amidotransferase subunit GatA [Bacillota bacterium]
MMTLTEILPKLASGAMSSRCLTEQYLAREQRASKLNLYITKTTERALATAGTVDALRQQGTELPLLAGVPVAVKDNIAVKGVPLTCASRVLADYRPPADAHVITALAQSPLLGKLNLDEFAMGSSNEHSAFGPVRNPWDLSRVPGGSSGGSAAAVAAGCVPFALGSDTGGSIRQPASFCGVVGMRPSYGRVSRRGLVAFSSSIDQIGPLTRTVADCAYVLNSICGHDPGDSTSCSEPVPDFTDYIRNEVTGLRIGIIQEAFDNGLDTDTGAAVMSAARALETAGARLQGVSLPYNKEALACYHILGPAEASSNLARFDGIRFGVRSSAAELSDVYKRSRDFGPEVKRRLMLGTYVLGARADEDLYNAALRARTIIRKYIDRLFAEVDVLLLPTTPGPAFKLGEQPNPLTMYMNDYYTIPSSLAGLPAISMPCGFTDGLPVGLQLVAARYEEGLLIQVGHTWQCLSDWHLQLPEVG